MNFDEKLNVLGGQAKGTNEEVLQVDSAHDQNQMPCSLNLVFALDMTAFKD